MARKYKKDIKVVLPHIDPFRDIAVYGAGEEIIKAMGGVVHAGIKKPAIVPTNNSPYFKKYGDGGKKKLDTSVNPTKQSPIELHQEIYRKANYTPYVPTPEELYSKASGRLEQSDIDPVDILNLGTGLTKSLGKALLKSSTKKLGTAKKLLYNTTKKVPAELPGSPNVLVGSNVNPYENYFIKYKQKDKELQALAGSKKIDYNTYTKTLDNYKEELLKEIGLTKKLGSGSFGEVFELPNDASKVIKLGSPSGGGWTPKLIESLKSVKQNANLAIPEQVQNFEIPSLWSNQSKSKKEALIMPNLNITNAERLDLNKRDRYALFLKQARQLRDKGIKLDVENHENFKYNKDKNVFDIYDLNPGNSVINPGYYMTHIRNNTKRNLLDDMMYQNGGYIRKYAEGGIEDKEVPINAANPYLILDEGKEFTVRPEEESPEDTYANYMANKNKDASLAEAMFVTPIDYVASYPQAAMMKALTGKYGEPSDKIGYENPEGFLQHAWNFGVNAIADPSNISGVGLIDDVAKMGLKGAAKNSIKNTGNALYSIADNIDNTVGNIGKRVNKGLYSTGDFIDRNVNNIQAAVTGDYKKAIKQRGTGLATYNNPSLDEGKLAFEQRKAEKLAFWETPEGNQRLAEHLKRNNSPLSAEGFKRDFQDNVQYSTNIKARREYQKELIKQEDFEFHKKRDLEKKMDSIYGRISRAKAIDKDPNIPANIKKANAEDLNNLSKEWQDTFDETTYQEELLKKLEKDIELHNFDKDNAYSWGNDIYIGEDLSHPVNLGGTMEHELSGHAVDMKSQVAGYKPKINNTSITQNLLDNVDLEASDMPDHIQELFRKHGDKKELKKFLKSMTKENYSPEYQQFLQNPIGYFKGSKNYWLKGAKGQNNEPTAFMAEARDYLFKKGHTKTLEEPITEDILEKAFTEYRKDRNMKGMYRLFDIVNPTKKSIKTLTKEINALPSWVAPVVGTTAVGTLTDQLPEQAPAQYSYGGYYKKYK